MMDSFATARRAWWCVILLAVAACGGDGGSGPPRVASLVLSGLPPTLTVGRKVQLVVQGKDAQGNALAIQKLTYSSSAPVVASIASSGMVTALAPGVTSITATGDGRTASVTLTVLVKPVSHVVVTPRTATIEIGGAATFTAQTRDASGGELGRVVTWTSSDPSQASVSNEGVVTGLSAGSIYIVAASEGKRDSAQVRVRSASAPVVSGATPAMMLPGGVATISGSNFSSVAADNDVSVSGTAATVVAATPTTLTITVPSAAALPCTATGPVPVTVVVAGDTATLAHPLRVAVPLQLAVGQSTVLTDAAAIACNELPASTSNIGSTYYFTLFNAGEVPFVRTSFFVRSSIAAAPGVATAIFPSRVPTGAPTRRLDLPASLLAEARAARQAHDAARQIDRRFSATHRRPLAALRRRAQAVRDVQGVVAAVVPNVGDVRTFRMRRTLNDFGTFDDVPARVVYVGPKLIIYEDNAAPLAGTMDVHYQGLGAEFDASMYPILQSFGDPLAIDAETDADGRVIALFSKRVNDYLPGLLGFVTACDFFPNSGTDPNQVCPSSNVGELFYAEVPVPQAGTPGAEGAAITNWRRIMRSTLVHEVKHITANAERFARDANALEESWLEEATAQQASEIWSRQLYGRAWKANVGWDEGPSCDFDAPSGPCGDNAIAILHHFIWLHDYYANVGSKSPLSSPGVDGTIYGSAWSFVRWATDQYGADEGTFLRALVQQQNDIGVANLSARTGRSFAEMVGHWSLATLVDDLPGLTPADPRLSIPSWNTRSILSGMSRELRTTGGGIPFPLEFPLLARTLDPGAALDAQAIITSLPGGGFTPWLFGVGLVPRTLAVRAMDQGLAPAGIGLAIVRER